MYDYMQRDMLEGGKNKCEKYKNWEIKLPKNILWCNNSS